MKAYECMELAVKRYKRGSYTLEECERVLNEIISDAMPDCSDIDQRLAAQKKLKRKAWRLLLDATK